MIVGFCGLIGSGKTTAAAHLVNKRGYSRLPFAGPLKSMIRALGLSEDEVNGHLKEAPCDILGGKTPRWAMQTLGTEWGRALIDDDLWVRAWKRQASMHKNVVSDDVRFPNEAAIIKTLGGVVIAIMRPGLTRSSAHVSESLSFVPDGVINNDGTVEWLHSCVDCVLESL